MKMKAIFCYDGPLYKDEKGNYFDSILNDKMFERYFTICSTLTLAIRTKNIDGTNASKKMEQLTNPNIRVVSVPNLSSMSSFFSERKKAINILTSEIKKADVAFIRLPSVIGNLSVDICKSLNKKYLIEVVGCPWDSYWNYSFKGKLLAPFAKYMMKKRIEQSKYTLYVTNEFLQRRYPTKGKTIACSNVELDNSSKEILNARLNSIYSNKAKVIIGTAAGLDVKYKGQQFVIKALSVLKNKYGIEHVEYQLIGNGSGQRLIELAKKEGVINQLVIIGQIPHFKVFKWFDSIDIYAQPSKQEGLPRSVIEAMSRGVPCIGSKTAGIPELIEQDFIFSNGTTEIDEIVNVILKLIKNKDLMAKTAKRNFEEAAKYERFKLVERRSAFFKSFVEDVDL